MFLSSGGQGGDTDRGNGKQKGLLLGQRTKNHFPKRGKHKSKELTPNQPNYSTTQNYNNSTPSLAPTHKQLSTA